MRTRAAYQMIAWLAGSCLIVSGLTAPGDTAAAAAPAVGGWGPPETVSTQPSVPDLADVAVSASGEMAAIWATDGVTRVARRTPDGRWSQPVRLSSASYPLATSPRLAYDASGRLTAAWIYGEQGREMYIEYRRTRPDGTWGGAHTVGQWDSGHYSKLDLVANADGDLVLGWLTAVGVYLADKAGPHYPASKRVWHAVAFDLAIADNGLRVAALTTDDGTTQALEVIRKQAGGTWSDPAVLWTGSDVGTLPTAGVAVDAAGTATVVWRQPGTAGTWNLVASRAAQDGDWSAPEVVSAKVGLGQTVVDGTPDGKVLVVFRRYSGTVKAALYDGAWGEPVLLGATSPSVTALAAAIDPSGRAVALWSSQAVPGALGEGVFAAVMTPAGDWPGFRVLVPPGQFIAPRSLHAGAGHGDLLASWSKRLNDGTFVVTARVWGDG